ncbi:hypothetical protein GCM10009768_23610 [Leucobacter iarius]|uniref:K+-transporting ATPase KdpF subunit n=1 Tax=Leucobacter iarius TaxID=333963 RepID=A0ABP4XXQ7_9MICO
MLNGQSSQGSRKLLGIIEIVAVIIGVAALVYLVYALLKADRF